MTTTVLASPTIAKLIDQGFVLPSHDCKREWDRLVLRMVRAIELADACLAKFAEKLADDPAYAFEWSDGAFDAAAEREVHCRTLMIMQGSLTKLAKEKPGDALNEVNALRATQKELVRMALQGAKSPKHSTSAVSNLMDQARTKAWASLAEQLGYMVD